MKERFLDLLQLRDFSSDQIEELVQILVKLPDRLKMLYYDDAKAVVKDLEFDRKLALHLFFHQVAIQQMLVLEDPNVLQLKISALDLSQVQSKFTMDLLQSHKFELCVDFDWIWIQWEHYFINDLFSSLELIQKLIPYLSIKTEEPDRYEFIQALTHLSSQHQQPEVRFQAFTLLSQYIETYNNPQQVWKRLIEDCPYVNVKVALMNLIIQKEWVELVDPLIQTQTDDIAFWNQALNMLYYFRQKGLYKLQQKLSLPSNQLLQFNQERLLQKQ